MYDEEGINEEKSEDKVCPQCGLRQYGKTCFNCDILLENEELEDLDKKKEDEYDEYDYRERR